MKIKAKKETTEVSSVGTFETQRQFTEMKVRISSIKYKQKQGKKTNDMEENELKKELEMVCFKNFPSSRKISYFFFTPRMST